MQREVERIAAYVQRIQYDDLSSQAILALKIRILDSLGCAIGALSSPLMQMLRLHLEDFGGTPRSSLIGGHKSSPDRAAFYNGALIRYLDFNDSFLAQHETCHPSDNIGAILAACEYAEGSGKDFITATAIAYQIQCRLSEEAPVRKKGFDHTTQGAYAVAAGVSKALKLSQEKTAHAIAMAAVANNALRVTRTGVLSHWKGLAYPNTAFSATHAAFLALRGVTGPLEIFEGNKGFMETISGQFHIDWEQEDAERVTKTIIKKFNAEIHSQSAIEGILELKLKADEIEKIDVFIFDVAFHIIGGGEEGNKKQIKNKEEADHSLPYMLAVAILDKEVTPAQYVPERIIRSDVQQLLQKITIHPDANYTKRFPQEMPVRIEVTKKDGTVVECKKVDYEGFFTRPMGWDHAVAKFSRLAPDYPGLVPAVLNLEHIDVSVLTKVLRA